MRYINLRLTYLLTRTVLTAKTVDAVEELVQSQEDQPQSHLSTHLISRELGISRRTVSRIVDDDLLLKINVLRGDGHTN